MSMFHNYNNQTVASGVLIINAAKTFRSPLRDQVTVHRNPDKLVTHCINELRSVATRREHGLRAGGQVRNCGRCG